MSSTVSEVFGAAGLEQKGCGRWGSPVPLNAPGVYVVALTADANSTSGALPEAPVERKRVEHLLTVRPELRLDGVRPDTAALVHRLRGFWLPDEVVLYIGLAGTSVSKRVRQYYMTALGEKRPHAGGWWLKTLGVLDELTVHWAPTPDSASCELRMLASFAAGLSTASLSSLHDGGRPAPFANLRTDTGLIKRHGITGATGASASRTSAAPAPRLANQRAPQVSLAPSMSAGRDDTPTQRVTAKDLEAGRIRLPKRTKRLLPSERTDVEVLLRGVLLRARWDPRMGPPERSGVLGFGKGKLTGVVRIEEILQVAPGDGRGLVELI